MTAHVLDLHRHDFVSIPLWSDYKVPARLSHLHEQREFQFHFGPIIRWRAVPSAASTKEFQFHFGPIIRADFADWKCTGGQVSIPLWSDYKPKLFGRQTSIPLKFQFHFGPIISPPPRSRWRCSCVFQFHFGPIISRKAAPQPKRKRKFQFHFGPIIRPQRRCTTRFASCVSIPLWSDYKHKIPRLSAHQVRGFNSTLVRL